MNITLEEINKKRDEIFTKQPINDLNLDKSRENKPRRRSVTEINANYLEIGDNPTSTTTTTTTKISQTDTVDNSIYMTYINKKLGNLDKNFNTLLNLSNKPPKSYICLFIVIVILFAGFMALNDYLALKFTNINLE